MPQSKKFIAWPIECKTGSPYRLPHFKMWCADEGLTDIRTRNKFPLKAEFSAYLYECKYRPSSVWTYASNLSKLNNNLFESLKSEAEPLPILEVLSDDSLDWGAIREISDTIIKIIDSKISSTKLGEYTQPGIPMTVGELMSARTAFRKYILFLKQRSERLNKNNEKLH